MRVTSVVCLLFLISGFVIGGCSESTPGARLPAEQAVIRRGNIDEPETLDPVLAQDVHTFNVLIDLYEGLVAEDAGGKLVPGVAESWAVSEDGLTYSFKFRRNARWSNGTPVTAEDFVRGLRRAAAPSTDSAYASLLNPIENFRSVNAGESSPETLGVLAVDSETLLIRLGEPCAYLLNLLAMPVAYPLYEDGSNREQFEDPSAFVGNGAYVLEQRRLGNPIKLRRSQHYWNASAVKTEFVEYIAISNELAEFNMYRAGELDITGVIPTSHMQLAKEQFAGEVRIAPYLAFYYLAFDLTEPPLDNRVLRQALSMAIDREQLTAVLGRGEQAAYAIVPPGVGAYSGSAYQWRDMEHADRVARARELYESAGFGPDNRLSLKYLYDAGGVHESIALTVAAMWEESLGVVVEFDKREWMYFLDTRDNRNEWQVMRFSWFGDYNDASTFLDIFSSDSVQNLPRYSNPEYDELLQLAAMQVDVEARAETLAKAERRVLDDYPIVPLYFYVSKHMVKPDIKGFENNVLDRHPSQYLYREQ